MYVCMYACIIIIIFKNIFRKKHVDDIQKRAIKSYSLM